MVYFLKLHICVYLRTKIQLFSIILTSFRPWIILPTPPYPPRSRRPSSPQNQPLKSPPRLGLKYD